MPLGSAPFSGGFHAPVGYVAFHGRGYVVAVPQHFVAKAGSVPNQPAQATVTELTPGGVAAALALTRLMGSMLFEVSPADPLTYAAASSALIAAALLGSYLPARRAAKVDPMEAIRAE